MKLITKIIGIALLSLTFISTGSAFADFEFNDDLQPYEYFAGLADTYQAQTVFDFDSETPFLFYSFSADSLAENPAGLADLFSTTVWTSPTGKYYQSEVNTLGLDKNGRYSYSISLSNWDAVKVGGDWTVDTIWYNTTPMEINTGAAATSFTVTPEPVSMLLMGIGGLGLYFRRKK